MEQYTNLELDLTIEQVIARVDGLCLEDWVGEVYFFHQKSGQREWYTAHALPAVSTDGGVTLDGWKYIGAIAPGHVEGDLGPIGKLIGRDAQDEVASSYRVLAPLDEINWGVFARRQE